MITGHKSFRRLHQSFAKKRVKSEKSYRFLHVVQARKKFAMLIKDRVFQGLQMAYLLCRY